MSIFRAERAADLEPLAVRLGEAGLPFRVRSAQQMFDLLTREEDEAKVREALGEMLAHRAPTGIADEPHFDPEGGYAACPACGCRLAPRAEECPECGLAVGAGRGGGPLSPVRVHSGPIRPLRHLRSPERTTVGPSMAPPGETVRKFWSGPGGGREVLVAGLSADPQPDLVHPSDLRGPAVPDLVLRRGAWPGP